MSVESETITFYYGVCSMCRLEARNPDHGYGWSSERYAYDDLTRMGWDNFYGLLSCPRCSKERNEATA